MNRFTSQNRASAFGWTIALLCLAPLAPLSAQPTERASVDSDELQANDYSVRPEISDQGSRVTFHSVASNLVPGDINATSDVFLRDLMEGTTEIISINTDGIQGNQASSMPALADEGFLVAFESFATNLVDSDTNGVSDIFVRDRLAGTTTRVSVDSSGAQANDESNNVAMSLDGRYVVFDSDADNLVPGDTNGRIDVFLHDRDTGITTRVSLHSDGTQGNDDSLTADVTHAPDGVFVTFASDATNLVDSDTNGYRDIFVHNALTGITKRVSVDSSGVEANHYSNLPAISANGKKIAFSSRATNLVDDDTNDDQDIFVYDCTTSTTLRVSVASDGTEANSNCGLAEISSDGKVAAYFSYATNLVPGDTNDDPDIFLHTLVDGSTYRVNLNSAGEQADDQCTWPSLSADGSLTAFQGYASNLVADDTNAERDVFVRTSVLLTAELTPSPGDPFDFEVAVATGDVGALAMILLSCTGTDGFSLGNVFVPLRFDACTLVSFQAGALLSGRIDAFGRAKTPTFPFPDVPTGTRFHAAAVILGDDGFSKATDAITITTR